MFVQTEKNRWIKTCEKVDFLAEIEFDGENYLITFFIRPDERGFAYRTGQRMAKSLSEADVIISSLIFDLNQEK